MPSAQNTLPEYVALGYEAWSSGHCTNRVSASLRWYTIFPVRDSVLVLQMLSTKMILDDSGLISLRATQTGRQVPGPLGARGAGRGQAVEVRQDS